MVREQIAGQRRVGSPVCQRDKPSLSPPTVSQTVLSPLCWCPQLEEGVEFIHSDITSFEVGDDKLARMELDDRVRRPVWTVYRSWISDHEFELVLGVSRLCGRVLRLVMTVSWS